MIFVSCFYRDDFPFSLEIIENVRQTTPYFSAWRLTQKMNVNKTLYFISHVV